MMPSRAFIVEMADNATYPVARNVARKLPRKAVGWDYVGVQEWNRCTVSSLQWQSDEEDCVDTRKYGNKRFEKGRRRHA